MEELGIDISDHTSAPVDAYADATGSDNVKRKVFRCVRDELTEWIEATFAPVEED